MTHLNLRFPNRLELVIVALFCAFLFSSLWLALGDLTGPAGSPIPTQPPDETRRIHNELGFSMVAPPNWRAGSIASLVMAPMTPGRFARRSKALVVFERIGPHRPAGGEGWRETSFLGQKAYEMMKVVRHWTFDDGAWSQYSLQFPRAGDWYELKYAIADERTALPDMVRQYINTFRWDDNVPETTNDDRSPAPSYPL
jgi:hypothetical protein